MTDVITDKLEFGVSSSQKYKGVSKLVEYKNSALNLRARLELIDNKPNLKL